VTPAPRPDRPGGFSVAVHLLPHYRATAEDPAELRSRVAACAAGGMVRTFLVSGGPTGADGRLARAAVDGVLEQGARPVVTLPLAELGKREALARVDAWGAAGVRTLLVVTGDHPAGGAGRAPRFALESVQLIMALRARAGREGRRPDDLRLGCVVNPYKLLEPEAMWQYARLGRKLRVGADFVVAQAGYDAAAWEELARFCGLEAEGRPLIGTVLVPDADLARRISAGAVPGVRIPPGILERLQQPGGAAIRLAGAVVAALRALGYGGVLLGGRPFTAAEVADVLAESERLAPRWRECLAEFGSPPGRFALPPPGQRAAPGTPAVAPDRRWRHPLYVFSHLVDSLAFDTRAPLFRPLVRVCRFCDTRPFWKRLLWLAEYASKRPLYGCRMCGDCTLYACGFLCVESGCPKRMVNGPCGGSRDGRCEVAGAGTCLWVTAYRRLKDTPAGPGFPSPPIPAKDRSLQGTSSWLNFCLGRDHRAGGNGSPAGDGPEP
jgi:methylenetetrahydrofolate reductase (NADPH)